MFLMWIVPLALIVLAVYAISGRDLAGAFRPVVIRRTCPNCGQAAQSDWKVCPHCGRTL